MPFPGTPDAAASSQVIFSTLDPSQIRWVSAVGSRSGSHGGHLTLLPAGAGTAFVPDRPFTPGESVQVSAGLSSPAAGAAAGAPGASRLGFSFSVGVPAGASASAPPQAQAASVPTKSFYSAPTLHPPVVDVTSYGDPHAGDIFLTTNNMADPGPMILNSKGQLVWYLAGHQGNPVYDFRTQKYLGKPVLTYWQGSVDHGHGINGQNIILNQSYHLVADFHAGNGYSSDLHEFQITPQNTALIDAFVPVHANLTSVGGSKNGTMLDCVIQELNIKTGQVLWSWHMFGHVPITDSHMGKPGTSPFDPYHLNSIEQLPGGNLLISARNTWATYVINKSTGKIVWQLGGRHTSFHMGKYTNFEWQHDARLYGNVLSVFDDAALPQEEAQSVAKEISLNMNTMTATMLHSIGHQPPLLAGSLGNVQHLPDGNLFVGWGSADAFSEYTPHGKQIFNGSLPLGINSYRAFRLKWHAQPSTPPAMAIVTNSKGAKTVYASWNGATQVASWQLVEGSSPSYLSPVGSRVPKKTFETAIPLTHPKPYVAVEALGGKGKVLGTSAPQVPPSGGTGI